MKKRKKIVDCRARCRCHRRLPPVMVDQCCASACVTNQTTFTSSVLFWFGLFFFSFLVLHFFSFRFVVLSSFLWCANACTFACFHPRCCHCDFYIARAFFVSLEVHRNPVSIFLRLGFLLLLWHFRILCDKKWFTCDRCAYWMAECWNVNGSETIHIGWRLTCVCTRVFSTLF